MQKMSSSSSVVRLNGITLDTGGIYRCEVSNEFPDFDTITSAEILSVVGECCQDKLDHVSFIAVLNPAKLYDWCNEKFLFSK